MTDSQAEDDSRLPHRRQQFEYELPVLRKRKRSPTLSKELAPSNMTLRKRIKRSENDE